MSYVPPHLRKSVNANANNNANNKNANANIKNNKMHFKNEFPALAPAKPIAESKMDFKELFNRRKEIKKRIVKMKKGWIKLSKNGNVDSLTETERSEETLYHKQFKMNCVLEKYTQDVENDIIKRIEYEGLEPEILEFSSTSEEESETSEESYVDDYEEEEF